MRVRGVVDSGILVAKEGSLLRTHNACSRYRTAVALTVTVLAMCAGSTSAQQGTSTDVMLDPEKQKQIWNLEHNTFLIETYFGKPFVEAWIAGDRKRMKAALKKGFRGSVLDEEGGKTRQASLVTEHRRDATPATLRPVKAAGYVGQLQGYLSRFAEIRRARMQVLDIRTTEGGWSVRFQLSAGGAGQAGELIEHLSQHRGEFRYEDEETIKSGGKIIAALEVETELHRSSPRGLLEEVTDQVGFSEIPLPDNWRLPTRLVRAHRYQFAVEDYDRDGFPDVAVAVTNGRQLLLRSARGERFEDVTSSVGIEPAPDSPREKMQNALVGWIDYDNDGFPDLLMGPRLYHNDEGRRFVDVTESSGLEFELSPFGVVVADYDNDGLLDLYIVNQKGFEPRPPGTRPWVGDEHAGTDNDLWHNEGDGRFKSVTEPANAGGGLHQTFAAASFFFNDDAYPDLYLANDFGANVLLENQGDGTFKDVTEGTGTGDFATSMGVAAGDLNNDGNPELYVANMFSKMGRRIIAHVGEEDYPEGLYPMIRGSLAGNRLYSRSFGQTGYDESSERLGVNQVGWAFAPAMVDLDGDGWLDLYAATGFNSADRSKPDG